MSGVLSELLQNRGHSKAVLGAHCTCCFSVNKLSDIYLALYVNYTNYNWNYNGEHIKHIIKLLGNKKISILKL